LAATPIFLNENFRHRISAELRNLQLERDLPEYEVQRKKKLQSNHVKIND